MHKSFLMHLSKGLDELKSFVNIPGMKKTKSYKFKEVDPTSFRLAFQNDLSWQLSNLVILLKMFAKVSSLSKTLR